nr:hypothetical protein [Tanacetum cinerariifolium]
MAVVKMGFKPMLAVVESKSESEEAEADDKADAKIQLEGILEEGVHGMYEHIPEIPLQRIEDIEAGQTDQHAKNLIANGERSSLLEHVAAIERTN